MHPNKVLTMFVIVIMNNEKYNNKKCINIIPAWYILFWAFYHWRLIQLKITYILFCFV